MSNDSERPSVLAETGVPGANPLVSVTLTNCNYGQFLGRAIESVQRQTFSDFEIIVVDNASTDDSVSIVQRYMHDDPRIRLIVNPENIGVVRNHKRASDEVRGAYMVHLDADDWIIDPDALQLQVDMLNSDPDISLVFSPLAIPESEDRIKVVGRPFDHDIVVPGEVAIRSAVMIRIVNSGPMMRMSAFRNFGGYNLDYDFAFDIKLAIDMCAQGKIGYINKPFYAFFHHPNSLSRYGRVVLIQDEMCKAIESAFSGPLAGRIENAAKLRRRALNHTMFLHPTQRIFANRYWEGWRFLWDGLWRRPLVVLDLKPLLVLVVRTILGSAGWSKLLRVLGKEQSYDLPSDLGRAPALEARR